MLCQSIDSESINSNDIYSDMNNFHFYEYPSSWDLYCISTNYDDEDKSHFICDNTEWFLHSHKECYKCKEYNINNNLNQIDNKYYCFCCSDLCIDCKCYAIVKYTDFGDDDFRNDNFICDKCEVNWKCDKRGDPDDMWYDDGHYGYDSYIYTWTRINIEAIE